LSSAFEGVEVVAMRVVESDCSDEIVVMSRSYD
jgi:hypothetical protein